ncbi:MAG: zinc-dependent alcohol dehydrogenase family protein [Chloroflexi bacterium]|nr:zinc-dependent alcohol dehydrogenase family protein [Chloroflexota bacterium]
MKANVLHEPAAIDDNPLEFIDVAIPQPGPDELLVKISACGVCHTDLHVVEGDLPDTKLPVIPGHEIVGTIEAVGENVKEHIVGERVGIFWLHDADETCQYCKMRLENLCPNAHWTGYTAHGGYAEYIVIPANFVVPIPDAFDDVHAAPLLCAGVVGYRSLRLSDLQPGEKLGIYGFGASGHLMIQVANHWHCEVYVFTRSKEHQQHARELGAVWVGDARDEPPHKLDRSIIFAPAGWIVPLALGHLRKAGTLCINAIHMSDLPAMPYHLLWEERTIRSVANVTRNDAAEFLQVAAEIPIQVDIETFHFSQANEVLKKVKASEINGAAVLTMS